MYTNERALHGLSKRNSIKGLLVAVLAWLMTTTVSAQQPALQKQPLRILRTPQANQAIQAQPGPQQSQPAPTAALDTYSALNHVSTYLRIDGIPGPAAHRDYRGWIPALGFTEGIESSGGGSASTGGRSSTGRSLFKPLNISKAVDAASVPLRLAAASGRHIPRAELALVVQQGGGRQGGLELYRVTLEDVVVTGIATVMQNGNVIEKVDLNFGRVTWQYRLFDNTGRQKGVLQRTWDLHKNSER